MKKLWGQKERLDTKRRAGVVVPVSYLKSSTSLGIGDFEDLKRVVDLAVRRGETIVQILPILDSGSLNLWPYSPISAFALNPVYIHVQPLISVWEMRQPKSPSMAKVLVALARLESLNQDPYVRYSDVRALKLSILKIIFRDIDRMEWGVRLRRFRMVHRWLPGYSLFSAMAQHLGTEDWAQWPEPYRNRNEDALASISEVLKLEIRFFDFLQYVAWEQMLFVRGQAQLKGVKIKGDVPALMDRSSVDVWQYPSYFCQDLGSGAPPDAFTQGGQEWGMPPIDVHNPKAVDYLVHRYRKSSFYMDYVRLDHVLGFYRLMVWNKKRGSLSRMGHFFPMETHGPLAATWTPDELGQLGIDPAHATTIEGVLTDRVNLGGVGDVLVQLGLTVPVEGGDQLAWVNAPLGTPISADCIGEYPHRLDENEDVLVAILKESGVEKHAIATVLVQRRRLFNLFVPYLDSGMFVLSIWYKETWQYQNLSLEIKTRFDALAESKSQMAAHSWQANGEHLLNRLIRDTSLAAFAEDLGAVDPYLHSSLAGLHVPGLDVLFWVPSFAIDRQRSSAVFTPSTHDTESIADWWATLDLDTKSRFNAEMGPLQGTPGGREWRRNLILRMYSSNAQFVMIPFWEQIAAWYDGPNVRINTPGQVASTNWTLRMPLFLDVLLADTSTQQQFLSTIRGSDRIVGQADFAEAVGHRLIRSIGF